MGKQGKNDIVQLGTKVRELRVGRGMSQDRVSLSANVDQSGYSKFERGLRSFGHDALNRIADALGLSFEEMVRGTELEKTSD